MKLIQIYQIILTAAPSKTIGWPLPKSVTPDDIKTIVQNHEIIQSILEQLVGDLKEASENKDPAKSVPALESAIKKLTEVLPKVKFELMIKAVKGITKETQDLAKVLSTSPGGGMKAVNAFIKKRSHDINSIDGSHNFMERQLQVTNTSERFSFE